ncbi:hypothetical protein K431DRAFT_279463 [Polychaeton citri CBS 116435]|uniref:MPN domain-containing protein n=1 Tax=Polychaeton citri CBS 116435 TaxID=1314669 RepID=A0A9P4Q171_9PEZI|nr:hypothetical protein K431DRAFT_279463 [Polychaeton citri CBS 116435]
MALSRHASITRPLSIAELAARAADFDFSVTRPLQSWLRSAKMLLTEASICEQDGDLQMAYLYLYRHAELVLSKFPQHPEVKDTRYRDEITRARKDVHKNLIRMEEMKPRIQESFNRYLKAVEKRDREAERRLEERRRDGAFSQQRPSTPENHLHEDIGQAINAVENNQLAVDLTRQELRRRDFTRQAGRPPRGSSPSAGQSPSSTKFNYPTVPSKEETMSWDQLPAPARPAKDDFVSPPSLPPKQTPSRDTPSPPTSRPHMPAHKYTITSSATTESGHPLRSLLLPPDLRAKFLSLAAANTSRNLECCGILCGTLVANALTITHLIMPSQTSTTDTCDTTPEGDNALFDYCDENSLLVCGWIHTHPTQSCFLSSRDCHTTSGYQVMLPEAIAIVCAPRSKPDWGIFRLTDPPGLPLVLECRKPGTFHPHEVPGGGGLYTDAVGGGGHVVEAPGLGFEVVDLRT